MVDCLQLGVYARQLIEGGGGLQHQETEALEKVNDDEGSRDSVMKNECAGEQSAISPAPKDK